MNGKVKIILLIILLIVVGGTAFYKTEKTDQARAKAAAIQQQKAEEAAAAQKAADKKYVAPQTQATQVVGATTYPNSELLNMANEGYAQFMHNSNTYNFQSVISKSSQGDKLIVEFSATCNGQPQNITVGFAQVNNEITMVSPN
ncbi:MAG: hypothetical protein ACRC41_05830 [Sarcina sp.]